MSAWSAASIPSQIGKLAVITGATGGLGFETAFALAGAGAEIVLTGRNSDKGAAALRRVHALHPAARISFEQLDLASLANVAAFAERFAATHDRLDILVNNAGVMAVPQRQQTADGFELQFGTNYLGHFALTGHLLPFLRATPGARVVNLSSIAARNAAIDFSDLQATRDYQPWRSYGQSKLAMQVFATELQRRSDAGGWHLISTAAHPGISHTELMENGPGISGITAPFIELARRLFFQSAADGALPQLYAATAPDVVPGGYYGPDGFFEIRGAPKRTSILHRGSDPATGSRLWAVSEELTGTPFPTLAVAA